MAHLDDLLDAASWDDHCPNGLQVPGSPEVEVVASAVSASLESLEAAAAAGADLVLVHHGLFWEGDPRSLSPQLKRRLERLFDADASLVAYHLPLDAHPHVGNAALLLRELGIEPAQPFGVHRGRHVGWAATAADPLSCEDLVERVGRATGREPLAFLSGPPEVRAVGVVTGGGGSSAGEAVAAGLDAFITGEAEERSRADAREGEIHFIAAGHHATETFGVRALGELLADRFGVAHVAIETDNPV